MKQKDMTIVTYLPVLLVEDMDQDASICPTVSQFPQSKPVYLHVNWIIQLEEWM